MEQKPNMLLAFLQELVQRFFTKSPLFFRIWQWVSAIAAALTGLPDLLTSLGVTLPHSMFALENKFIAALTTGMWIMSRLTTQSKVVGITNAGIPQKQTNASALPFTSAIESNTPPKATNGDEEGISSGVDQPRPKTTP